MAKSKAESKKHLALIGFQNGQVNKLNARIDNLSRSTRKYMEEKTIYVDSNERLMGTNKQLTLQIESLSDTIQKTPNINNKLKKSFDENNKILYEKTSELEQLRIQTTRLTHSLTQQTNDIGNLKDESSRLSSKSEILSNLLKVLTSHLGPTFADTIRPILEIRTDFKSDILECYRATVENLENLCIRLEHRLLEYSSPLLEDWVKLHNDDPQKGTPDFTKRDLVGVGSGYLSRGTLEPVSTEREKRRGEVEGLIGVL